MVSRSTRAAAVPPMIPERLPTVRAVSTVVAQRRAVRSTAVHRVAAVPQVVAARLRQVVPRVAAARPRQVVRCTEVPARQQPMVATAGRGQMAATASTAADGLRPVAAVDRRAPGAALRALVVADARRVPAEGVVRRVPVAVVAPRVPAVAVGHRAAAVGLAAGCTATVAASPAPAVRSRPGVAARSPTSGVSGPAVGGTTTRLSIRTGSIPGAVAAIGATATEGSAGAQPPLTDECGWAPPRAPTRRCVRSGGAPPRPGP